MDIGPTPSKEFLEELVERAKRIGWDVDYHEVIKFMQRLYDLTDYPYPDFRAYEDS